MGSWSSAISTSGDDSVGYSSRSPLLPRVELGFYCILRCLRSFLQVPPLPCQRRLKETIMLPWLIKKGLGAWALIPNGRLGIERQAANLFIWGTDANRSMTSRDLVVPIGLVTRARAKKFKDKLNDLIQEVWIQPNSWKPIEHKPRDQQRCINMIQFLKDSSQVYNADDLIPL
ncbi:uncharacterized protein LOC116194285 isoform X1 [Punica granatum]|uniref:Uncharacterized protein LOC116194285 isoform X1 n=1 Tax=Punica granatum TaxID=22663 RepID=A0A218XWB8_PUNGR|nr:uncharacterized protein LOC116194285 isoform X1 [Punica granatum]OWM89120.1 hypothetical protein CDL15_Pgr026283 [Punica granatum]